MRTASLPPEIRDKTQTIGLAGLQLLGVLALALWLHGSLPHAFCQGSSQSGSTGSAASNPDDADKTVLTSASASKKQHFTKPYGYYLNPILEHIQANREQRIKITAIVQSFKGRIQPLTDEYKQKNQEFLDNVAHGKNPEVIMDEQTQLGRLYSDITLNYCQMSLEVRRVLTPDQIVHYEEFKRQHGWVHQKPQNQN